MLCRNRYNLPTLDHTRFDRDHFHDVSTRCCGTKSTQYLTWSWLTLHKQLLAGPLTDLRNPRGVTCRVWWRRSNHRASFQPIAHLVYGAIRQTVLAVACPAYRSLDLYVLDLAEPGVRERKLVLMINKITRRSLLRLESPPMFLGT